MNVWLERFLDGKAEATFSSMRASDPYGYERVLKQLLNYYITWLKMSTIPSLTSALNTAALLKVLEKKTVD